MTTLPGGSMTTLPETLAPSSALDDHFPFTAIVGQDGLSEALLACAVDPGIGGVLVRGERGTAKSTSVRALAPLLPAVEVIAGCAFSAEPGGVEARACPDGPHDGAAAVQARPARLVELPVGATADRLVGTLDLERALSDGAHALQPGLLAAAHRGILYVDEVNLLPDHLVDVLLDAAAMGRNHVERDGISASHPARFLLVGTMNPEEGELRPQLLDRFGLSVAVAGSDEPSERAEIVRRRLAHDADPGGFGAGFAAAERELAGRIAMARRRLSAVRLADRALLTIAGMCARLGVDGMRADIVCARTATALAALDGADEVQADHIRRAAALALPHRRRRGPLEAPGLSDRELEETLQAAAGEAEQGDPDDDGPGRGGGPPSGGPNRGGGPSNGGPHRRDGPSDDRPERGHDPGGAAPESPGTGDSHGRQDTPDPVPAEAAGPADLTGNGASSGATAPAPERREAPSSPGTPPLLALAGAGHGPAGRRSASVSREGHPIDARPATAGTDDLAVVATVRAAACRRAVARGRDAAVGSPALVSADLHEQIRAGREGNLVVFCVDASGSMGARRRMAAVKGAILGLLLDAYQRRDRIALVTFRGERAELALPPTASVERAAALLRELPTGGGTPLDAGLRRAAELIVTERRRAPERRSLALVVTDGRASRGRAGREAALTAARTLARTADSTVVFDAESGRVRLGLAAALATAAGARLLPVSALDGKRAA